MIRVRIISSIAGTPAYHNGQIVDLEDRIAVAWIADGLAVPERTEAVEIAAGRSRRRP